MQNLVRIQVVAALNAGAGQIQCNLCLMIGDELTDLTARAGTDKGDAKAIHR